MEVNTSYRKRLSQSTLNGSAKKQRIEEDTIEKRAGVVKSMILKNFMCHSLLEVKFVNNTSVVIGQNGSGKSAILTALVLGLGGNAALTNRGTNVKGFVKAGTNSATIEITLHNGGPMAYRPKVYGDTIVVIRHFTASGANTYRIKSHTGELISTQAREIKNITISLNIQVDNPICILNQDTSRNFLSSNDPKQKFILFTKATKLDTLATEYANIISNMRNCMTSLDDKTRNLEKMKNDLRKLKMKVDQHKSAMSLKDTELLLQIELEWAKSRDAEIELKSQQEVVDNLIKKCNDCKLSSTQRNDELKSLKDAVKDLQQKFDECKNTVTIQSRLYSDARQTLEKLMGLTQSKDREKRSLKYAIDLKKQDIQHLEQEIANSNEDKIKVEEERAKRAREIEELEQKLKANNDILETARNELFQIKSDIERKADNDQNLKQEIREIEQQINQHTERLNSLRRESGNTLLLYGQHIPRVKQMIEQNKNKFQKMPRGPLGSYIKLKDKKWAVAAEGYIGAGLLNSFVVDNKHDNQLLLEIFRKVVPNRVPTIITTKFFDQVHNVSQNLVHSPSDCIALFDLLEIEDPVVANCIIDESRVEGVLLIPNEERAMTLLSNRENVPRNCTQGVTIKGDKYFPDPNYKTYCSDYHHAHYLQVDTTEHSKYLKQKLQLLDQQKQAILSQYNQVNKEKNDRMKKQNELETKVQRLTANRKEFRRKLDSIRLTAEPEATNVDILENEIIEVRKTLDEKQASLEKLNIELKELAEPTREIEEKIRELKSGLNALNQRLASLGEQMKERNKKIQEIETSDKFQTKKVREYETRLQEQQVNLVEKKTVFEKKHKKAQDVGPKPSKIRQVAEIMDKIDDVGRALRQTQTSNQNLEQLIENYTEFKEKCCKADTIVKKLREDVNELELAVGIRKKHYKVTEGYFINFIKHAFRKILEFRQFKGSLDIDVEAKKLILNVIPQHGTQGLTTTSNLSGGERSFSTVAFLYSLWQCMDFPFYFLDEFDVYMDKLNRTKVFDILLHHASTKPELQFVFLTPQDISFLKDDVTVLRLEDPKRFNA